MAKYLLSDGQKSKEIYVSLLLNYKKAHPRSDAPFYFINRNQREV